MLETIKKEYEIKSFKIDSKSIEEFHVMETRRQISNGHVRQIHGAILSGKNPIGILIVNLKNNKMRIIDGNHRIEALKRFYAYRTKHEKISVEVTLKVYKNLTNEEERNIYSLEAKRKNESYEDRLNMYKDVIILWDLVTDTARDFPCKVSMYPTKVGLRFRTILNALFTHKNSSGEGYTTKYLTKDEIVGFAQSLMYDDFLAIREFVYFFQKVFGRVETGNIHTRIQFFIPIFDLFMRNKDKEKSIKLEERFRKVIGRSELLAHTAGSGREAQMRIRELMVKYMNHGISKNLFI